MRSSLRHAALGGVLMHSDAQLDSGRCSRERAALEYTTRHGASLRQLSCARETHSRAAAEAGCERAAIEYTACNGASLRAMLVRPDPQLCIHGGFARPVPIEYAANQGSGL